MGIRILNIEGKDLVNGERDYRLADGRLNIRAFSGMLDNSLDSIKLREVYKKVLRNDRFCFSQDGRDYTVQVVCVKFRYSLKSFNKASKNTYVACGIRLRDVKDKMSECVFFSGERLLAITLGEPAAYCGDERARLLAPLFAYRDGMYVMEKEPETLMTRAGIRAELYEKGFDMAGIHYVRWKRSAGSSRAGKCLFINEALFKPMRKWESMGTDPSAAPSDLAAFEAYIALTSSSIIATMEILPENILVIDDYVSAFKDEAMGVFRENGVLTAREGEFEVENSVFDGQSLMDISLFPERYAKYSMLLLRQRMFKSACFKTDIAGFFRDNGITDVNRLKGFTLARDISQIKLITTPSSIKYVKFGELSDWLRKLEPVFGIVKHEKPTRFFGGRKASLHYQLINTLDLSDGEIEELLRPTLEHIAGIKNDPAALRLRLKMKDCADSPEGHGRALTKNEIMLRLLSENSNFTQTNMYKRYRDRTVNALIREAGLGHILINGDICVLFGNPAEMLLASIGRFDGRALSRPGTVHTKRFGYGKTILGSRSPHVCAGNIFLAENEENEFIDRYFPLTKEIVCVNSIHDNLLQRLNGADFDSDAMLLTDDELLVSAARRGIGLFPVPTNLINAAKKLREYSPSALAELDEKTGVNKIGEIINLSQLLNSIYFHRISAGQSHEQNAGLYRDICVLAVLSNIEIDKAKREYDLDTAAELKRLKEKYSLAVEQDGRRKYLKPMFFKTIAKENGYSLPENCVYSYFDTPMDMLKRRTDGFKVRVRVKSPTVPFSQIIGEGGGKLRGGYYYKKRDELIEAARELKNRCLALYGGYKQSSPEERELINQTARELKERFAERVSAAVKDADFARMMLKAAEAPENSDIRYRLMFALLGRDDSPLYGIIKKSCEPAETLVEDENGDVRIYDISYRRTRLEDKD